MKYLKYIGIPFLFLVVYFAIAFIVSFFISDTVFMTVVTDMFISVIGLCYYKRVQSNQHIVLSNTELSWFLILFVLVWLSGNFISTWYYSCYGDSLLDNRSYVVNSSIFLYVVLTLIVAPVCEEILMRGILFQHLKQIMPIGIAAIISSSVFSVLHGTIVHIIVGMLFGLYVTLLYQVSGSLKYAMIAHCIYNLVTLFASSIVFPAFCFTPIFSIGLGVITVFVMIALYIKWVRV